MCSIRPARQREKLYWETGGILRSHFLGLFMLVSVGTVLSVVPCSPAQTTISVMGTNVVLGAATASNRVYDVQRSDDLSAWSTIVSNVAGTGGIWTNIDIGGAAVVQRFYRVRSFSPNSVGGTVGVLDIFVDGNPAQDALTLITYSGNPHFAGYADGNGRLLITNVSVGTFSVRAYNPVNGSQYADASGVISQDGDLASVTVTLPGTGNVNVQVNLANGSNAVSSATYTVYGGSTNGPAFTNPNGQVTWLDIPVGNFTVIAHDPNTFSSSTNATGNIVSNGATVNVTLTLPARN